MTGQPAVSQAEVFERLADPDAYPVRPDRVERIDTHTAHVFLAGDRAYKAKREVRYSFLDYSTLERRRLCCEAEVRLNRRTAPELYLGVTPVTRDAAGRLTLDGDGPAVEWLVVMRRFPDDALLDRVAASGGLTTTLAVQLADAIADFHARAVPTPHEGGHHAMVDVAADNAGALAAAGDVLGPAAVRALTGACERALEQDAALLETRRAGGFVRQCHGDLHLRNLVLIDGQPTLFDAIEFNDTFACIDVWYDVAFLIMDLLARGLEPAASVVFNHYLLRTSDLGGLRLLPLFLATRAAVRAKTSLAAAALERDQARHRALQDRARDYLRLAGRCLAYRTARLIAIGGPSGSGKSTLAARLAPGVGPLPGAVVLRSDVLRKVLLHHAPTDRLGPDAYTADVTDAVYRALDVRAGDILAGGGTVIVDATFLSPASRADIAAVAARVGVPFTGLWLEAPAAEMAARLQARVGDASDATVAVLESQLAHGTGEIEWQRLDTSGDPSRAADAVKAMITA